MRVLYIIGNFGSYLGTVTTIGIIHFLVRDVPSRVRVLGRVLRHYSSPSIH